MTVLEGARTTFRLLDHGYIADLLAWGSDEFIVETARVSTQKGFLGWGSAEGTCSRCLLSESQVRQDAVSRGMARSFCSDLVSAHDFVATPGDEKLLRYLYEHAHSTPFEFAGLTLEIQAPIFVFREWHRHRTQSYSEASARYSPLPDLNYIPSIERLMMTGGANKQAGAVRGADALTWENALREQIDLKGEYDDAERHYQRALQRGVPKELARLRLPVGRYSKMRATANLRNWLAFLTLRQAPQAQYEIRVYADAVGQIIAERFPRTWELFNEKQK